MRAALFCGSACGNDPIFVRETRRLIQQLASQQFSLVYGGGKVGLMGCVADTAIDCGMDILGVMPEALVSHELAHPGLSELKVVRDMHERKSQMAASADCFIALPGGAGTLEEIIEAWTWAQLGLHNKPCAFFNVNGFYDPLLAFFEQTITDGFMKQAYADMLIVSDDPTVLVGKIGSYTPPPAKWSC